MAADDNRPPYIPASPLPADGSADQGLGITLSWQRLYASNLGSDDLSVIDPRTGTIVGIISGLQGPAGIVLLPRSGMAYVSNSEGGRVSVIDTTTGSIQSAIPVGERPWNMAAAPDGSRVYVVNRGDNTISVIDTASNEVEATLSHPSFGSLWAIAVSPMGNKVYLPDGETSGRIFVVNPAKGNVEKVIETGASGGSDIAVAPDGRTLLLADLIARVVSWLWISSRMRRLR